MKRIRAEPVKRTYSARELYPTYARIQAGLFLRNTNRKYMDEVVCTDQRFHHKRVRGLFNH